MHCSCARPVRGQKYISHCVARRTLDRAAQSTPIGRPNRALTTPPVRAVGRRGRRRRRRRQRITLLRIAAASGRRNLHCIGILNSGSVFYYSVNTLKTWPIKTGFSFCLFPSAHRKPFVIAPVARAHGAALSQTELIIIIYNERIRRPGRFKRHERARLSYRLG